MEKQYLLEEINGAKVFLYPIKEVKTVLIKVLIKAGSWYEDNQWGKLHLLEHLIHHGSKNFPSRKELEIYKENFGLSQNAWTGGESMGIWVEAPDECVNEGIFLANELLFNSNLNPERIEKEIKVISQEFNGKWSNPYNRFDKNMNKMIYGDSIYIRDGMGDPKNLKGVDSETLQKLYKKFFQPQNMIISIVGNFNTGKIKESLSKMLNDVKNISAEKTIEPKPEIIKQTQNYLWHKEEIDQVNINLLFRTKGKNELSIDDRVKYRVGSYILGNSSRSLLYKKLREENALVYSVNSSTMLLPTIGMIGVNAATSLENALNASKIMFSVTQSLSKLTISDEDFQRAIKFVKYKTTTSYDSVEGIASDSSNFIFSNGYYLDLDDYAKIIEKTKLKDIQNVYEKIINKDNLQIGILSKVDPKINIEEISS